MRLWWALMTIGLVLIVIGELVQTAGVLLLLGLLLFVLTVVYQVVTPPP